MKTSVTQRLRGEDFDFCKRPYMSLRGDLPGTARQGRCVFDDTCAVRQCGEQSSKCSEIASSERANALLATT